tara:strand:- start:4 stop:1320 length:1317 start_codon:yes stop_codon:yes gene_type:complete
MAINHKELREFLKEYVDILGIPGTGNYNVVSTIRNLENTVYFAGQPGLISQLLLAVNSEEGTLEEFKTILDGAIADASDIGVSGEEIAEEQGVSLSDDAQAALDQNLQIVTQQIENGALPVPPDKTKEEYISEVQQTIIDQAYTLDPQEGTRLIKGPDGQLQVFAGYFDNVLYSNIFSHQASVPEIVAFQNYLMDSGLAIEQDFAGTRGQYSEVLRQKIQSIMDWADENVNAGEGSPLRDFILSQEPVFFSDVQYQDKDISFERNLFNFAVQEMSKQKITLDKINLDEQLEAEAVKYIPPRQEKLEMDVEDYFVQRIGRTPTASELAAWSRELASSYDESYASFLSYQYALDEFKLEETPIYSRNAGIDPITERPRTTTQRVGSKFNFEDLQGLQPKSPAEIFESQFEETYEGQIEDWQKGQQIKDMQNKIMSAQFGA